MRPGHHRLPVLTVKRFALLMQLHHLTEAHRVAARHGVTAEYVRRQWRELQSTDMDAMWRSLQGWLDSQTQHSRINGRVKLRAEV